MGNETGNTADEFSARDFREALSTFATGVTIVTACDGDGEPVGMTASSFNSVSMDPPLILWSVTKTALSAPTFQKATHFAVHVLATDQTDLSNRFAQRGGDKFSSADYTMDHNQVPILSHCATRFDCKTWAIYEGGDHWIIVGLVENIDRAKKEGLVFGGGSYAIAAPLTTVSDEGTAATLSPQSSIESMLFYHLSRAYHQMGETFHEAVRNHGLTLAEWRIGANIFGGIKLDVRTLAARTFLDLKSLDDILFLMARDGNCTLSQEGDTRFVTGTPANDLKIKKLLDLCKANEKAALGNASDDEIEKLKGLLKLIVDNTSN